MYAYAYRMHVQICICQSQDNASPTAKLCIRACNKEMGYDRIDIHTHMHSLSTNRRGHAAPYSLL